MWECEKDNHLKKNREREKELEAQLTNACYQRSAVQRKLDDTQKHMDKLKESYQEAKKEVAELKDENKTLTDRVSELERSYNCSRDRNSEQERELAYLQEQLQEKNDSRELKPETNEMRKEIEYLNQQLAQLRTKEDKNSDRVRKLRHDLEEKIAHNNRLNGVIKNLNDR